MQSAIQVNSASYPQSSKTYKMYNQINWGE